MKALGVVLAVCLGWGGSLPCAQAAGLVRADAPSVAATVLPALDVLHWWTSASERSAADQLSLQLAAAGVQWHDAGIPGGGGMAAYRVLNSRMLSGDLPDVAQLIGSSLVEWSDMGMVLPLSGVAARQKWAQLLLPTVLDLVTYRGTVIAVPLGIHRINTLLYSRKLFARLGLRPPTNWSEFEAVCRTISAAGFSPLAWSDEAWQIATVFESLLLSEGGSALYRELVVQRNRAAWMDPRVGRALLRLRWLRGQGGNAPSERPWTAAADDLKQGQAAMLIMGDWAKGELVAWGASADTDVGCVAVPGTAGMHLYSIDTLAMLRNAHQREVLQEKMAEAVSSMAVQLGYNRVKGSVPVRRDLSAAQLRSMDGCARASWETFAAPAAQRLPSLAHRMAGDEVTKDAVAQTLRRYLLDPAMDTLEAQRRLGSVIQLSAHGVQP